MVRALIQGGRIYEAAELANQAAGDLADPLAVAQLRIMLSTIGLMRCRWEEATSHAGAVLSEPGLAEHLYAEAKLAQLRSFMSEGNEIGMRSLVASIMGGDNRPGETTALGAALVVSAKWAWDGGRPADTVAFLRAAIARADQSPRHMISGHPRLLLAAVLASLGVEPEARILINHSAERIRQTSDTMWAPAIPVQSAELALSAAGSAKRPNSPRAGSCKQKSKARATSRRRLGLSWRWPHFKAESSSRRRWPSTGECGVHRTSDSTDDRRSPSLELEWPKPKAIRRRRWRRCPGCAVSQLASTGCCCKIRRPAPGGFVSHWLRRIGVWQARSW